MDCGNERDDSVGGIGLGGPQTGDIGGEDRHQQQDGAGSAAAGGEGQQRHPGGSSRDSKKLG